MNQSGEPIDIASFNSGFRASQLRRVFVLLIFACACFAFWGAVQPSSLNRIQRENLQPGTTAWQLCNPADKREIEGYASLTSVAVGGNIDLFVNTEDATYRLTVFRMGWYGGKGGRKVLGPQTLAGVEQVIPTTPPNATQVLECHWTNPFRIHVPTSWLSGIYLVKLHGNTSGKESYIIFTVRDSRRADLVFQQAVITYQAYNSWPEFSPLGGYGYSLYDSDENNVQVKHASFSRPYGSFPSDEPSFTPPMFYNSQFGQYGIGAKGFLSPGHDEYWSEAMKSHVVQARDLGVGLGFFGGNYMYWAVDLLPDANGSPNRTISLVDPTKTCTFTCMDASEQAVVGGLWANSVPTNGDIVIANDAALNHWVFAN